MAETEAVNIQATTEPAEAPAETTQERTFTQAEVDSIIQGRLGKERAKFSDYEALKEKAARFDEIEEANKSELQKATERADELQKQLDELTKASALRDIKSTVAKETGVPEHLLSGATEEDCRAQAKQILEWAKPQSYPAVKDGGSPVNVDTRSTADQFADWFKTQTK